MLQDSELKTDFWMTDIEKQLCQYVRYEKLIPRLQEKLIELKGTLQVVTGPEWTAYQDEIHQMLAHTIDFQILYLEECLQRYLQFRQQLESAIKVEFEEPRYKNFITLYWGSTLPKSEARDLVMHRLQLSQTTFYRWRKAIISKMALRLTAL